MRRDALGQSGSWGEAVREVERARCHASSDWIRSSGVTGRSSKRLRIALTIDASSGKLEI